MDKYYVTGETNKGKHGGHKPKLITEEHCTFLRELMEEDCTITLEYMQEQLEAVDGLRVGISTIHYRVIGFHYSFKIVKKQCMAAITDAVKDHRRQYSRWLINAVMEGRNLVYLDEVGFQVSSRVNRGRAEKGESARLETTTIRSRNISCMSAIHRTGVVHYEILEATANGERFRQYLHGLQEALLMRQIADPIIIMDNVGFHHMDIVLEEMIILGLDHHFLPPYSPFFNPIENMFSQWKHYVRVQKPRTYDELTLAMNNVRNVISAEDCNNYITRSIRNCQACINGQDYFDN